MSKPSNNLPLDSGSNRRSFLRLAGAVGATFALAPSASQADSLPLSLSNIEPDRIPHKPFGHTKETLSIIGLGGFSLGSAPSLKESIAIVHEAVDAGVTFFDNAWDYHDGKSEEWMG